MFYPANILHVGGFDMRNKWVMLIAIQLVMFGMGTQMSLHDFAGVAKAPRGVFVGIVCHFSKGMPLVGLRAHQELSSSRRKSRPECHSYRLLFQRPGVECHGLYRPFQPRALGHCHRRHHNDCAGDDPALDETARRGVGSWYSYFSMMWWKSSK